MSWGLCVCGVKALIWCLIWPDTLQNSTSRKEKWNSEGNQHEVETRTRVGDKMCELGKACNSWHTISCILSHQCAGCGPCHHPQPSHCQSCCPLPYLCALMLFPISTAFLAMKGLTTPFITASNPYTILELSSASLTGYHQMPSFPFHIIAGELF